MKTGNEKLNLMEKNSFVNGVEVLALTRYFGCHCSVGISGDTSDNDELAAIAGVAAAGLVGDGGTG